MGPGSTQGFQGSFLNLSADADGTDFNHNDSRVDDRFRRKNMSATAPIQYSGVVKLDNEEQVKKVLIDSVLGLWDVVNNLTRLKPSQKDRYRVTIFGSARAKPGTEAYEETKRASKALAEMGCDIITGGGPGLMQAANAGV